MLGYYLVFLVSPKVNEETFVLTIREQAVTSVNILLLLEFVHYDFSRWPQQQASKITH